MSADAPLRNKRVRVVNTSQAALNGQVGLATTFDDGKGRCVQHPIESFIAQSTRQVHGRALWPDSRAQACEFGASHGRPRRRGRRRRRRRRRLPLRLRSARANIQAHECSHVRTSMPLARTSYPRTMQVSTNIRAYVRLFMPIHMPVNTPAPLRMRMAVHTHMHSCLPHLQQSCA